MVHLTFKTKDGETINLPLGIVSFKRAEHNKKYYAVSEYFNKSWEITKKTYEYWLANRNRIICS